MRSAGVIGWPVAHSRSPLIHRFWLAKLGLDGDYGRFAVHPDGLGAAIRALPALGLVGVNVTVPHKVAALAHLDWVDPLAARIGAVNTIVVEDGRSGGYNTDVTGFHEPLTEWGDEMLERPIYLELVGTGGAARAVAHGWGSGLTIYGRNLDKARNLAADAVDRDDEIGSVGHATLDALIQPLPTAASSGTGRPAAYIVANATTLGMAGQPKLAINLDRYPDDTIVYDLVYTPLETPLLAAARARGLRTIDGLAMLIGQAAEAFALFFGAPAPREHDAELRALLVSALSDKPLI